MVQGVAIDDEKCIVNTNPATGEIISRVKCTTMEEVDDMAKIASDALPGWAFQTTIEDRVNMIRKGIKAIGDNHSEKLSNMIVSEMGKPIAEAKEEVEYVVDKDEYLDLLIEALQPKKHGDKCTVVRHPIGVVVVLSPWNFPADEMLYLIIPALGSGNTVIVKPSEVAPETGAIVVNALANALPPGVLQLAQGDGVVGEALVKHDKTSMIAMTGSSATGRKILSNAANSMKRVVLELGGKDPMIVFKDCDIEKSVKDACTYSLSNTGQVCCSIERIYVEEAIYEQFQTKTKEYVSANFKVGNGKDPEVNIGPMVSKTQCNIVKEQIKDAVAKGAKLLYQSDIPTTNENATYHPVTLISDVTPNMDMYYQETFGPVIMLLPFSGTEADAIKLANDTEYGLGSAVYTTDTDKATRVASAIDAGQVGINCYAMDHMETRCPWVGLKASGFGYHSGIEGFHQFSAPKTIVLNN